MAVASGALLALLPLPAPAAGAAPSAAPADFDQRVLFKASQERGYACFRIPAIVRSTHNTLLAFAEGRKRNCGDSTDIDLVLKRSTDGGRTWGPLRVVDRGNGDTHGNPAPVVDRASGRIVLATTHNKGRADAKSCDVPCDRTPHMQYSDNDGVSWSPSRNVSRKLRPRGWNSWYATGPVHGIQLAHGRHRGRLVFSVNAESWNGHRVTANHAALMHSDDGGRHWHIGAVDSWPISPGGTFRQKPSEMTLAERRDGAIYVNGREQDGVDLGNRDYAVSRDGGDSFAAPFRTIPDLYSPMVQGSVIQRRPGRWLLSLPGDPDRRRTMMIRSSYDEGRTWESADRGKAVTNDWSGYSDMVTIDRRRTGLLYEGGAHEAREEIRFARFTERWLGPRRAADHRTRDRAAGARAASVLGDARPTDGRFGPGLAFDGKDDAVRLPYRDSLPLGSRDFTAALWFRYGAAGGEQPLLWMGGVGDRSPQVALWADPAGDRISGRITVLSGSAPARTAVVSSQGAYNDGQWHHLALRRGGGRLVLTVDGVAATAPDVPGTVSRTSPFGVHLGQRTDSRAYLTGDLDEARVYGRALSDAELDRFRTDNSPVDGEPPVLWLPLDRVGRF